MLRKSGRRQKSEYDFLFAILFYFSNLGKNFLSFTEYVPVCQHVITAYDGYMIIKVIQRIKIARLERRFVMQRLHLSGNAIKNCRVNIIYKLIISMSEGNAMVLA